MVLHRASSMERMKETPSTAGRQEREANEGIPKTGDQESPLFLVSLCVVAENKEPLVRKINLA